MQTQTTAILPKEREAKESHAIDDSERNQTDVGMDEAACMRMRAEEDGSRLTRRNMEQARRVDEEHLLRPPEKKKRRVQQAPPSFHGAVRPNASERQRGGDRRRYIYHRRWSDPRT